MSDNINIIEIIKNIPNNLELTGSMLIVALVGILIVLVELRHPRRAHPGHFKDSQSA